MQQNYWWFNNSTVQWHVEGEKLHFAALCCKLQHFFFFFLFLQTEPSCDDLSQDKKESEVEVSRFVRSRAPKIIATFILEKNKINNYTNSPLYKFWVNPRRVPAVRRKSSLDVGQIVLLRQKYFWALHVGQWDSSYGFGTRTVYGNSTPVVAGFFFYLFKKKNFCILYEAICCGNNSS